MAESKGKANRKMLMDGLDHGLLKGKEVSLSIQTPNRRDLTVGNDIYKRRVKEIMSRNVVSLKRDSAIQEALTLMVENRVSALPVVDARNHCVGILTSTDLVNLTSDVDDDVQRLDLVDPESQSWLVRRLVQTFGKQSIAAFVSDNVFTATGETTLAIAARDMLRNQVHHLPVVDLHNRVVGIISTMDILAEFADGA